MAEEGHDRARTSDTSIRKGDQFVTLHEAAIDQSISDVNIAKIVLRILFEFTASKFQRCCTRSVEVRRDRTIMAVLNCIAKKL